MDREIKFRARDEEANCFISQIQLENIFWDIVNKKYGNRFILMQYTGQHDKNGKEIWEGDIVNIKSTYETDTLVDCNATVLFRDGRFTTDYHDLQVCGFTKSGNWEGEVIGNRWDNPEMLKEKNDHI